MIRAEKIRVDTDEGRYVLVIDTDAEEMLTVDTRDGKLRLIVDIHDDVLEFYASVRAEIRPYVIESDHARAAVRAGVSLEAYIGAPEADDGPDYDLARDLARGK